MNLKKVSDKTVCELVGKKLFFIRFFRDYIKDVYGRFPELSVSDLAGIFEPDVSKQGTYEVEGHSVQVMGFDKLKEMPADSVLLITTGYYRGEYEDLLTLGVPKAAGDTIYYFANKDTEYYEEYLEKNKDQPLEDMIVFRSGMGTWEHIPGMDFTENARALFEYLQREGYGDRYEMVWLVKEPQEFAFAAGKYKNVSFLSYDWAVSEDKELRDKYYRAICLAKYFFFTHACGFCRLPRQGQVRVQLWHGCGFKTVKNSTSQRHYYEYTTVVSQKYAEIHEVEFGLDKEQLLVTGYAKEDWLFHPAEGWKDRLGVPGGTKYIFWLPTFRQAKDVVSYMDPKRRESGIGLPIIESHHQLEMLNNVLGEKDTVLIVKLHPLQKDMGLKELNMSNICFLSNEELSDEGLHINEILGDADGLVSDYSSAAVDFLLMDRPIGFTLDDLEEYRESRGFVLNPIEDWIPGEKITCFEEFISFITSVCNGEDRSSETRRRIASKLHDFSDDKSCERIAKALRL